MKIEELLKDERSGDSQVTCSVTVRRAIQTKREDPPLYYLVEEAGISCEEYIQYWIARADSDSLVVQNSDM
jgi:hypothetical protein